MRKWLMIGVTVIGAVVISASPISIKWSAENLSVSQDKVRSEVGKPLSAGSVAGGHRRHERRDTRKTNTGSSSSSSSKEQQGQRQQKLCADRHAELLPSFGAKL